MTISKSIPIKKAVNGYEPYAVLTVTETGYSIADNTSTISWSLVLYRPSNVVSSASKSYSVSINGSVIKSGTYSIGGSGTKTIASGSGVVVGHNSDGSKNMSFGASVQFGITWAGTSIGTVSNSDAVALTKIPRVSDLSVNKTSVPADGATTVTATATKKYSGFTDTIVVKLGDYSQTVTSGTAFTIPKTWINAISGTSAAATVTVTTKSGTTTIGTKSVSLTVTVPDDVVPVISDVSITEAVAKVTTAFGNRFVQDLSQLNVSIDASGVYGSTINSYSTTLDGVTYIQQAFTSNVVGNSGTLTAKVTVTDSRGRKAVKSVSISVLPYKKPVMSKITYTHCDADGNADSNGTYTKVSISGKVYSVDNQNTKALKLKYRATSDESYTERVINISALDWEFTAETIISGTDPSVTFEYIAELTDKLYGDSAGVTTGIVCMSRLAGGKGVRFFGEAYQEGLMVGNIDYTITDEEFDQIMANLGGVVQSRIIDWIYPVGCILESTNPKFDPNDFYTNQTWERIAQGRVLMGADDNHEAGTTTEAGLPNITGTARPSIRNGGYPLIVDTAGGAFYKTDAHGYMTTTVSANTDSRYKGTHINFDASRQNPIYGSSDTVQPPAYFVYYWKRIA